MISLEVQAEIMIQALNRSVQNVITSDPDAGLISDPGIYKFLNNPSCLLKTGSNTNKTHIVLLLHLIIYL